MTWSKTFPHHKGGVQNILKKKGGERKMKYRYIYAYQIGCSVCLSFMIIKAFFLSFH